MQRLKQKEYSDDVIQGTIGFLKEKRLVDDEDFSRLWCESRLRVPLGLRRIRRELSAKGIDKEIIDACISRIQEEYSESETVVRLAREKFEKIKKDAPEAARKRVYAYLIRRGFSPDAVTDAVSGL